MLVAWQLMMAACGALLPHAGSLWVLVALVGGMNFAAGCVDCMGNVLLVKAWSDDDVHGAPAMNLLHAAWSAGSTVAPLLAKSIGIQPERLSLAYAVAAAVTAALSLPLLGVSPRRTAQTLAAADAAAEAADGAADEALASGLRGQRPAGTPPPPRRFQTIMLLMFGFYTCLGAAERIPGDWLATAIVRSPYLHRGEAAGAFATSAFFGAHLAGRLLSVPLAWWLRPPVFCALEFGLALPSALAFATLAPRDYGWLLVSASGLGLGIAALYPQGLLLAKSRAPLSSIWISRLVVGALLGAVLGPPLTGVLLEASPTVLFWAVAAVVLGQTLCFVGVAMMPKLPSRADAAPPAAVMQVCTAELPSCHSCRAVPK